MNSYSTTFSFVRSLFEHFNEYDNLIQDAVSVLIIIFHITCVNIGIPI